MAEACSWCAEHGRTHPENRNGTGYGVAMVRMADGQYVVTVQHPDHMGEPDHRHITEALQFAAQEYRPVIKAARLALLDELIIAVQAATPSQGAAWWTQSVAARLGWLRQLRDREAVTR